MHEELFDSMRSGDTKSLARAISLIENELKGYEDLLRTISHNSPARIIGITGQPGEGKSTIVDSKIGELVSEQKKVAVLCVDPSSPFNLGALLGDRIRMSEWYSHPNVFIRSLATRGSVGGLSPKMIEITDLMRSAGFDFIIVETVGVGQSEIEIAGLADTTVVVVVPESGDEVQTMKAGLMEIADVFVINKSDRPDADLFEKHLRLMLAPAFHNHEKEVPIVKTIATEKKGIPDLMKTIKSNSDEGRNKQKHLELLTEKAWRLLIRKKMKGINKAQLKRQIEAGVESKDFNLYSFIEHCK